ncbi:hypothetical protein B0J14DRAFT_571177 [Halenospora varia]|nr:hypothetical protein B0J14DRAFT_571177 [Halenospora varia]
MQLTTIIVTLAATIGLAIAGPLDVEAIKGSPPEIVPVSLEARWSCPNGWSICGTCNGSSLELEMGPFAELVDWVRALTVRERAKDEMGGVVVLSRNNSSPVM